MNLRMNLEMISLEMISLEMISLGMSLSVATVGNRKQDHHA